MAKMDGQSQSLLQQTLQSYSHLDLSHYIVAETAIQSGGGGCSDVFQSRLSVNWQPRSDPNIMKLLQLENGLSSSGLELGSLEVVESSPTGNSGISNGKTVSLKRLRFWNKFVQRTEEINFCKAVAVKRLRFWGKPDYRIEKVNLGYCTL